MKLLLTLVTNYFLLTTLISAQSLGGYEIRSRHVAVKIHSDGLIDLREEINVNFLEQRRGIYRRVPIHYNIDGQRFKLDLEDIRVEGHPVTLSTEGQDQVIRIGDPDVYLSGEQTYLIEYSLSNGIISYANHDEFYWNLIDFDTDAQTKTASFEVSYPRTWQGQISEYQVFSGPKGNTGSQVDVLHTDNKIYGALHQGLPPSHGITLALKIPKGLLPDTHLQKKRHKLYWMYNIWNLIPVVLGFLIFQFYRKFERQDKMRDYSLQYHPPGDMTPAEVGTFIDHIANRRDIISLLPYWGNHGVLKVKPVPGSTDLYFYKLKDLPVDAHPYEHELYTAIFNSGDIVLLSDLKEQTYTALSKASRQVKSVVLERPLFDPDSVRYFHSWRTVLVGLSLLVAGMIAGIVFNHWVAMIGCIFLGLAAIVIYFKEPKLSISGMKTKAHLYGLRDFLRDPDPQKIRELISAAPSYLHQIYPYVLAFDLDRSWTRWEGDQYRYDAPIWFEMGAGDRSRFTYQEVNDHFDVRTIEKVFYSTPPPSSSSGSGGFSGGGFGGGSTRSW